MRNWNYAQTYTLFSFILSKPKIFSKEVFTKRTQKILLDLTQKNSMKTEDLITHSIPIEFSFFLSATAGRYLFILLYSMLKPVEKLVANLTHNHHFKWWFDLALIRAGYMHAQKGGYRKRCYWSAYKAVLLESSFLDSSACSLIYFFI